MVWSVSSRVQTTQKLSKKLTALSAAALLLISSIMMSVAPLLQHASAATAGDVWITSAMPDPTDSSDASGEYVVLENQTAAPIDVTGWQIDDGGIAGTLSGTIAANSTYKVCRDINPATSPYADCDEEWSGMSLSNSGTEMITLTDGTAPIDQVSYTSSTPGTENTFSTHIPTVVNPEITKIDAYYVKGNYKGIGVDIHVDKLTDATGVEVKVDRTNGGPVIKTNKPAPGSSVLPGLNTGNPAVKTAPIVIQQGSYDEAGSSSWNQPSAAWDSTTVPTSITVTITRSGGTPLVETIDISQVTTPFATLAEVMPAATPVENIDTGETFSTIQAAIDDSDTDNGDTIKADAGTYPESVHITKGVTIEGANASIDPNTGTRSAESVIDNSAGDGLGNGFYIDGDVSNVTIDGFKFYGVKGATGSESGAVLIRGSATTATNLTVKNNIFDHTGRGINKDGNASFNGLHIQNNKFVEIGTGITSGSGEYSAVKIQATTCTESGCSDLKITDNVVSTTNYSGFFWGKVDGVNVSGNTISNTATYSIGAGPNSSAGGDTTIENNVIDHSGSSSAGAIRIKSGAHTGSVLVLGNTVSNSDIGVSVDNGTNVTGDFKVNENKLENVGSVGVKNSDSSFQLDALNNWWGDASGPTDNVNTDNSSPLTNPGGSGAAAVGSVKYADWCTSDACVFDTTKPTIAISPTPPQFISGTKSFDITVNDDLPLDSTKNKQVWIELYGDPDWSHKKGAKVDLSDGTGTFTVNTISLPNGKYVLRVGSVEDAAGNKSGDKSFKHFTVDNSAPLLTNFSLSDILIGSTDSNPTLTGDITDEFSDIDSVKYAIWKEVGGNPKGSVARNWTDLPAADGNFDSKTEAVNQIINLNSLNDGNYTLGVRGWDAADNKGSGGDLTFVIDRTVPTVDDVVLNGKNVSIARDHNCGPTDFNLVNGKVDLSATIADNLSGVKDAKYKIRKVTNGGCTQTNIYQSGTVNMNNPSADDWITLPGGKLDTNDVPADGNYTIQMTVKDNAGNTATKYVDITVDNTKPVGTATYSGGANVGGVRYIKSIDELSFTESITDNHSVVRATFLVQKFNTVTSAFEGFCGNWNASSSGSHVLGGSTSETYTENNIKSCVSDLSKWTDGTYKIFHAAYDEAGNEGKYNANRQVFVIDSEAPAAPTGLSYETASGATLISGDTTNELDGQFDWDDVTDAVSYNLYPWSSTVGSPGYSPSQPNTPIATITDSEVVGDLSVMGEGLQNICITAVDVTGNESPCSQIFSLTLDQTAPDVKIDFWSAVDNVFTPEVTATDPSVPLTYAWTANDADSANNVTISDDGKVLEPNFTANADGTYSFTLIVTDAAGNASPGQILSFTYTAPVQSFTGGQGGGDGGADNGFTNVTVANVNPGGGAGVPQVLGAAIANPDGNGDDTNGEIKGTNTSNADDADNKNSDNNKFLWLGWWWLLVLLGLGAGYWFLAGRFRSGNSE